MKLDFCAIEVLQDRMASSLGLDRYMRIMNMVSKVDVSKDETFQVLFDGFYQVRRDAVWRNIYYDYFEANKGKRLEFESVITYLYEKTGNIEASFSSKMIATLEPNKPIWDKYVLQSLGLVLKGKTQEEKLINAIRLYTKIEKWYEEFLLTPKAKECIKAFDMALPKYVDISNVKKIDTILWSIR